MVVTVAKGYDLGYIWKTQGQAGTDRTTGGYYINAAQAGEPPGPMPGALERSDTGVHRLLATGSGIPWLTACCGGSP